MEEWHSGPFPRVEDALIISPMSPTVFREGGFRF
jgi:hypothetical protein